eukprot:3282995-Amphidinium_carterae.1
MFQALTIIVLSIVVFPSRFQIKMQVIRWRRLGAEVWVLRELCTGASWNPCLVVHGSSILLESSSPILCWLFEKAQMYICR